MLNFWGKAGTVDSMGGTEFGISSPSAIGREGLARIGGERRFRVPTELFGTVAEFVAAANAFNQTRAFPLLEGAPLARYRERCELTGIVGHPMVPVLERPGSVVAMGSELAGACARLLAVMTGRPVLRLDSLSEIVAVVSDADAPVAIVGLASEFELGGDWPVIDLRNVGVVTGRNPAELATLVYRTLCYPVLSMAGSVRAIHPQFDPDDSALTSIEDLILAPPTNALHIRSHGRECCVNFPDGMICGRDPGTSAPRSAEDPPSPLRLTPCQATGACFRRDVDDDSRVSAADLSADIVFLESCSSVGLGNNTYSTDVGIGLGALSGSAVAVVGAVGMLTTDATFGSIFDSALEADVPFGRIRDLLEDATRTSVDFARFALLGDPALSAGGPLDEMSVPLGALTSAAVLPAEQTSSAPDAVETLDRLRTLSWLMVPVPDGPFDSALRDVRSDFSRSLRSNGALEGAGERAVGSLQRAIGHELAELIHSTWWDFFGGTARSFVAAASTSVECPICRQTSATRTILRHRRDERLSVAGLQCRRCGELIWSTGDHRVTSSAPRRVPATESVRFEAHNSLDRTIQTVMGCAFVGGSHAALPEGVVRVRQLEPGEGAAVGWGALDPTQIVDEHQIVSFVLAEGRLSLTISTLLPPHSAPPRATNKIAGSVEGEEGKGSIR